MRFMKYEEFDLSPELLRAVTEMGFSELTEIQAKAIPLMRDGKELLAKAPTGTGKTCAFGIPIVEGIDPEKKGVQALILCPTRELCTQLRDDFRRLCKYRPEIRVVAAYGGQPIAKQVEALKKNPQIVAATPGRLIDHIKHHTIRLNQVRIAILDEADEMLDMGFFKDVRWILEQLPKGFRLSMFSATISRPVMDIGWLYQRDPEEIVVQPVEENKPRITQYAIKSTGTKKIMDLIHILRIGSFCRTIVFCNTKYQTQSLAGQLEARDFSVRCINGDLIQSARNKIMADFKEGRFRILVVTDVAARGIDVSDVDAVINFDVPLENEYYLHRIGRTGRARKSGVSYTFYSDSDKKHLDDIIHYTRSEVQFVGFNDRGELAPAE